MASRWPTRPRRFTWQRSSYRAISFDCYGTLIDWETGLRAVLSELHDVLSEELTAHLKTEFRWLGALTGPTRDLDVLLLKHFARGT